MATLPSGADDVLPPATDALAPAIHALLAPATDAFAPATHALLAPATEALLAPVTDGTLVPLADALARVTDDALAPAASVAAQLADTAVQPVDVIAAVTDGVVAPDVAALSAPARVLGSVAPVTGAEASRRDALDLSPLAPTAEPIADAPGSSPLTRAAVAGAASPIAHAPAAARVDQVVTAASRETGAPSDVRTVSGLTTRGSPVSSFAFLDPRSIAVPGAAARGRATELGSRATGDAGGLPDAGELPALPSTGISSAASAASAAMTLALIAGLLAYLGMPGILRRISLPPVAWRPGPFLSLAERPG